MLRDNKQANEMVNRRSLEDPINLIQKFLVRISTTETSSCGVWGHHWEAAAQCGQMESNLGIK